MEEEKIKKLERSSKRSGILSLTGVFIFMGSLIYASISLNKTNDRLEKARLQLKEKQVQLDSLNTYFKKVSQNVQGLKGDEKKLTEFLIQLIKSSEENSTRSNENINWESITKSITELPSGKRKTAVLISLLMTWKEIPFKLGTKNPSASFDSPGFLNYVISKAGIKIEKKPNEFLSVALMNAFKKVDKPSPGDLIFYKGQTGNFGLMFLCDGIAIGTLQAVSPLAIYKMEDINTAYFPLRGFYRVNYEDFEKK